MNKKNMCILYVFHQRYVGKGLNITKSLHFACILFSKFHLQICKSPYHTIRKYLFSEMATSWNHKIVIFIKAAKNYITVFHMISCCWLPIHPCSFPFQIYLASPFLDSQRLEDLLNIYMQHRTKGQLHTFYTRHDCDTDEGDCKSTVLVRNLLGHLK